jgi:hypothetical protein
MPETGLPIRVYQEHDTWHVAYGEGEIEDHTSRMLALGWSATLEASAAGLQDAREPQLSQFGSSATTKAGSVPAAGRTREHKAGSRLSIACRDGRHSWSGGARLFPGGVGRWGGLRHPTRSDDPRRPMPRWAHELEATPHTERDPAVIRG